MIYNIGYIVYIGCEKLPYDIDGLRACLTYMNSYVLFGKSDSSYHIEDDNGKHWWVSIGNFKQLSDIREDKINLILDY